MSLSHSSTTRPATPELRFGFGRNWRRFLAHLTEERIAVAEQSVRDLLKAPSIEGASFLDVGSGSGLFSLAARRLGAKVRSFDYDADSVACTESLRDLYFPGDPDWVVERGSILDMPYLDTLGQYRIVYSWGVLHHTGQMWQALGNIAALVEPGGTLVVSLYNDQGGDSRRWLAVKKLYVRSPLPVRWLLLLVSGIVVWWKDMVADLLRLKPFATWRVYSRQRGMSPVHDLVDWVGGYPFEVAKPEQVFDFFRARGFELVQMKTCGGGKGCNEFVFRNCGEQSAR